MAHFAKLNTKNIVIAVNSIHDNELSIDGVEHEAKGIEFLTAWSGGHTNWKQTSFTGRIRKNFAGVGFTYDSDRDAFIPPKPYPSWVLDEDTCLWEPPIPQPNKYEPTLYTEGAFFVWNEQAQTWDSIPIPNLTE